MTRRASRRGSTSRRSTATACTAPQMALLGTCRTLRRRGAGSWRGAPRRRQGQGVTWRVLLLLLLRMWPRTGQLLPLVLALVPVLVAKWQPQVLMLYVCHAARGAVLCLYLLTLPHAFASRSQVACRVRAVLSDPHVSDATRAQCVAAIDLLLRGVASSTS